MNCIMSILSILRSTLGAIIMISSRLTAATWDPCPLSHLLQAYDVPFTSATHVTYVAILLDKLQTH